MDLTENDRLCPFGKTCEVVFQNDLVVIVLSGEVTINAVSHIEVEFPGIREFCRSAAYCRCYGHAVDPGAAESVFQIRSSDIDLGIIIRASVTDADCLKDFSVLRVGADFIQLVNVDDSDIEY